MMPAPLIVMFAWLTMLAAWISILLWEEHRDRQARARIGGFTHDEPLPRPAIDPPDNYVELDREWCALHHIAW